MEKSNGAFGEYLRVKCTIRSVLWVRILLLTNRIAIIMITGTKRYFTYFLFSLRLIKSSNGKGSNSLDRWSILAYVNAEFFPEEASCIRLSKPSLTFGR